MACRDVLRLAEVHINVVELPTIVIEIRCSPGHPGQPTVPAACDPSLVIDRSIAEHLEILGRTRALCARALPVEGIGHADSLDRLLRDSIEHGRLGDSNDIEN